MNTVVIVGAGLAGLRAAEGLRANGFDGPIVMVGDEEYRPYSRPPLSKSVLSGTAGEKDCAIVSDVEVDWVLGDGALSLDSKAKTITLRSGRVVGFDRLVIATGSRAREWPEPLPPISGLHTLRGIDDVKRLRNDLEHARSVVVVGGGFVGCEAAATLRGLSLDVHVVEAGDRPLAVLGPEVSSWISREHERRGVSMHTGKSVIAFEGRDGRLASVRLSGGAILPADIAILALGGVPNSEWLQRSNVQLDPRGGVMCDAYCRVLDKDGSLVPDVFAAGDVATFEHRVVGSTVRIEHWNNAAEMGLAVSTNMSADDADLTSYAPLPTVWSDQFEMRIDTAGFLRSADDISRVDSDAGAASAVFEARAGGDLVGVVTINDKRSFLKYRRQLAMEFANLANTLDAPQETYETPVDDSRRPEMSHHTKADACPTNTF